MPVHIDKIDTEIEIAPAGAPSMAPPTSGAAPVSAEPPKLSMRDAVLSVLEAELEEYLRMRG